MIIPDLAKPMHTFHDPLLTKLLDKLFILSCPFQKKHVVIPVRNVLNSIKYTYLQHIKANRDRLRHRRCRFYRTKL